MSPEAHADKRLNDESVAQLVEQYTFNVWVLGPSPSGFTRKTGRQLSTGFFLHGDSCLPH